MSDHTDDSLPAAPPITDQPEPSARPDQEELAPPAGPIRKTAAELEDQVAAELTQILRSHVSVTALSAVVCSRSAQPLAPSDLDLSVGLWERLGAAREAIRALRGYGGDGFRGLERRAEPVEACGVKDEPSARPDQEEPATRLVLEAAAAAFPHLGMTNRRYEAEPDRNLSTRVDQPWRVLAHDDDKVWVIADDLTRAEARAIEEALSRLPSAAPASLEKTAVEPEDQVATEPTTKPRVMIGRVDVTDRVAAMYDALFDALGWGSSYLDSEEMEAVLTVGYLAGFAGPDEDVLWSSVADDRILTGDADRLPPGATNDERRAVVARWRRQLEARARAEADDAKEGR